MAGFGLAAGADEDSVAEPLGHADLAQRERCSCRGTVQGSKCLACELGVLPTLLREAVLVMHGGLPILIPTLRRTSLRVIQRRALRILSILLSLPQHGNVLLRLLHLRLGVGG